MEHSSRWPARLCSVSTQLTVPNSLVVRHRACHRVVRLSQKYLYQHDLGPDKVPEVLRCLVVEAFQVENLAFVVVDVARWGVRLQSAVDGYLWGIRTHALAVDSCAACDWAAVATTVCGASDRKALRVGLARRTHRAACNVWSTRSALVDQNVDGVLI